MFQVVGFHRKSPRYPRQSPYSDDSGDLSEKACVLPFGLDMKPVSTRIEGISDVFKTKNPAFSTCFLCNFVACWRRDKTAFPAFTLKSVFPSIIISTIVFATSSALPFILIVPAPENRSDSLALLARIDPSHSQRHPPRACRWMRQIPCCW